MDTLEGPQIEERARLLNVTNQSSHYGIISPAYPQIPSETMAPDMKNESKTVTQYIAALAATGGALAAGAIMGWTAPTERRLKDGEYGFPISDQEFSWIGSGLTLGAACMCVAIGSILNKLGRKITMLLMVLPFLVGWALVIWAANFVMMLIGRILLGIAAGSFCVAAPIYIGEIAQKEIRGSLGTYFQLMLTIGILYAYVIGNSVNVFWLSIICGIIPIVFGCIFVFMPESPMFLVSRNRMEYAANSLKWLRGAQYDYSEELQTLQANDAADKERNVSFREALSRKATIRGLTISLGLMFFQQVSGINAVIFYQTEIFNAAKTDIDGGVATIIVGVMQVVATFVSTLVVDKLGRRVLLLASSSVMAICTILLGVYFYLQDSNKDVSSIGWLPIVALVVFIVMFSLGMGPVPWMMIGELFATDIKGFAGSLSGTCNWLLAFVVTFTFASMRTGMGNGPTFWLFSGLTILGFVFVYFLVPETKGKSLSDIQVILSGERPTAPTNGTTEQAKL